MKSLLLRVLEANSRMICAQGAERPVEWDELNRFSQLPLWVVFTTTGETGELETKTLVLEIEEMEKGDVICRRADVKANSPGAACQKSSFIVTWLVVYQIKGHFRI